MVDPHQNRLAGSLSPYLLMHATNPVYWYPWGDEAFNEAESRDMPVFLSIGYAACHWCHVMEQECFSDPKIASLLNAHFISIKVDREERPDIDQLYMTACQVMTGTGGWPMSIFLNHDRKPFYAATYIPKTGRPGMAGMSDLIPYLAEIWKNRREEVFKAGNSVMDVVASLSVTKAGDFSEELLHQAYTQLSVAYDPRYGGFGAAPKFPSIPQIFFLLRYYYRYREKKAWKMADHTLRQMAVSGIRDPLDGGFHRYATDQKWRIPHFEKMLYDQALLAMAYAEGYRISHDPFCKTVGEGILDFVCSSLIDPIGGFRSSVDADCPGGEGAYYLWTRDQILKILGSDDGGIFCVVYGITKEGNISAHGIPSGRNVLISEKNPADILEKMAIPTPEKWLTEKLRLIRESRSSHTPPLIDDKILTDWNGLMISALLQGYLTFDKDQYYQTAVRAVTFFLQTMISPDGTLIHHWHKGKTGPPAMSGDYVFLATALLDLFQADGEVKWINSAIMLTSQLNKRFWDGEKAGYQVSDPDIADLPVPLMNLMDSALPSVNGAAAILMSRLALLTGNPEYSRQFDQLLRLSGGAQNRNSTAMFSFFSGYMEKQEGFRILAILPDISEDARGMLTDVRSLFLPGSMIIPVSDPKTISAIISGIPEYRIKPSLQICGAGTCFPPIFSRDELDTWITQSVQDPNI